MRIPLSSGPVRARVDETVPDLIVRSVGGITMTLDFAARRRIGAFALVTGLFAGCGGESSNGVTIAGGPQVKTCSSSQDCNPGQVCDTSGTCAAVTVPPGGAGAGAGG